MNFMGGALGTSPRAGRQDDKSEEEIVTKGHMNLRPGPSMVDTPGAVEEMETDLAKELSRISIQDRESALHDVHGVAEVPNLDETTLSNLLHKMDKAISESTSEKGAFEKAKSLSKHYVENRGFRTMFLRSEFHDPLKAASRFLRHFELKQSLFGEQYLVRDIRASDLTTEEIALWRKGWAQVARSRDVAGRIIFCSFTKALPKEMTQQQRFRIAWCQAMNLAQNEETQLRGVVAIYDCTGVKRDLKTPISKQMVLFCKYVNAVPLRMAAGHILQDDNTLRFITLATANLLSQALRVRLRFYFGSHLEALYTLMTFGIPKSILPVDENGVVDTVQHGKMIDDRLSREKSTDAGNEDSSSGSTTVIPGPKDILLGRGRVIEENPGNVRLRHYIDVYGPRYNEAPKFEKTVMAEYLLRKLKDLGGRFLKREGKAMWIEVSDEVAREKISHAFRNQRSRAANLVQMEGSRLQPRAFHVASFAADASNPKKARRDFFYGDVL